MHKSYMSKLFSAAALTIFFIAQHANSAVLTTSAKQVLLFNPDTGVVLFEKNADQLMPPSSMTKIMTSYILFEHLKSGDITLKDQFPVSKRAWRKGGSKMFVELGSNVSVDDLLRGIIVQSGNDACIVVAEALAGNEAVFAVEMTRKAREMGATNTTFKNSNGWPDPLHLTTARDLGIMAERLIRDYPDMYKKYFGLKEFTFNNIRQFNRNPLLYKNMGIDGMKTGSTDEGGYGLIASGVQDGQRLIMVINGTRNKGHRSSESERIMRWGFRNFVTPHFFKAGQEIAQTDVWLGNKPKVAVVVDKDLFITFKRSELKDMKIEAIYDSPIDVHRVGGIIGKAVVTLSDRQVEVPLRAVGDVSKAGFFDRIGAAFHYLIWGYNEPAE